MKIFYGIEILLFFLVQNLTINTYCQECDGNFKEHPVDLAEGNFETNLTLQPIQSSNLETTIKFNLIKEINKRKLDFTVKD